MKALTLAAAVLVAACAPGTSSGSPSGAAATSTAAAPTQAATATPPAQTPSATTLDGVAATVIPLGADSTPIDVTYAFGSIWVASHHQNTVIRIDPITLAVVARIPVGNGPGWFAVTDDAVWVTLQLGRGLARIDPATNTSNGGAGMWATCYAPVVAFDSVWQVACDAGQLMRIDPATNASTDITVGEQIGLVLAGSQLLTSGPLGLSRIDPATNTISTLGGPPGRALGFAGGSVWIGDEKQIFRVDPASARVTSTLPLTFGWQVREQDGYAWLVQESTGVLQIDLETNDVLQTLPVRPEAYSAIKAAGALWVTSYGANDLWRLEP